MAGIDSNAQLVLHMDGTDGSPTFTDSSLAPYTVTAVGNAQVDTAQSKFGGASGLFDGTGDYLEVADSLDWQLDGGSDSNLWTIDLWVRHNGDPSATDQGYAQQRVDNNNHWKMGHFATSLLKFAVRSGGTTIVDIGQTWDAATATWYHVAIVKNGTSGYMHFIDGSQIGSTTLDTSTIPNFAAVLQIALKVDGGGTSPLNGWMDEFRLSKGAARWTANFTPPVAAYSVDTANIGRLMLMGVS